MVAVWVSGIKTVLIIMKKNCLNMATRCLVDFRSISSYWEVNATIQGMNTELNANRIKGEKELKTRVVITEASEPFSFISSMNGLKLFAICQS